MVELNQQLLLLSAIGADQEHCPMVLEAAPSTCETDLSLDAPIVDGAQLASSASTCARCAHRGRRAMRLHRVLEHENHAKYLLRGRLSIAVALLGTVWDP